MPGTNSRKREEQYKKIRELLKKGKTTREIRAELKCGLETIQKAKKESDEKIENSDPEQKQIDSDSDSDFDSDTHVDSDSDLILIENSRSIPDNIRKKLKILLKSMKKRYHNKNATGMDVMIDDIAQFFDINLDREEPKNDD